MTGGSASSSNRWAVLAVLSGALAVISLDNTIVNVALPTLQEDLDATTSQLQWVVDAYSVMFAGCLLLAGSLGDRFGRRRMLLIGLVIFALGSVGAALSTNADMLTAWRAVMGVGGAFIMPSTLSLLVHVFQERTERAQAIGIWAAVAGLGVALGPIVGGVLLEQFSWHAIFWVNPVLVTIGFIAAVILVPESKDPSRPRLDLPGAALSAFGLILLVVTIIEIPDEGITLLTSSTAIGAVVLLGAFVWWEGRAPRPILPLSLFKQRLFSAAVVTVGLVYFGLMGAMFFLPQFLQLVQGLSPLESGFAVLPGALGLLVASVASPRLAERFGTRIIVVIGMAVATAGIGSFSLLSVGSSLLVVSGTFAVVGLGLGMVLPQATNAVIASVPEERSGMGSAVNDAVGELGGSLGVAILGAAMAITYRLHVEDAITAAGAAAKAVPAEALDAARESLAAASLAAGRLPDGVAEQFRAVTSQAFTSGMGWALLLGSVVMGAGAVLAWLRFPERVDRAVE